MKPTKDRDQLLDAIADAGGLVEGAVPRAHQETGVPEAHVYGVGSFYGLLADPTARVRVCQGLSCRLRGSERILAEARAAGLAAAPCSCLAACDRPPAVLRGRTLLAEVEPRAIEQAAGDWRRLRSPAADGEGLVRGRVGPNPGGEGQLAIHLAGRQGRPGTTLARARELGDERVIGELEASGLQGRGGAGFPAAIKWRSVREQSDSTRYVVLNADEGEPGTFKDREVLSRRPDLVVEGLAIAAATVGAREIYCYLREAFAEHAEALRNAIDAMQDLETEIRFHLHRGHGAYICGEETALLEAIEGRRGLPRNKPPFPTEQGLWGHPTLIHNVETIACLPAIVERGGDWFRSLGRTGPGTKLYCVSGHVQHPGIYEMPLGVCLDELVDAAGGYEGELKAFSPGGASSGFLPASERRRPLDFKSLAEAGSMLGSAGVVVLNQGADLVDALQTQLGFFEDESCGQCAPCRLGTRLLRESLDRHVSGVEQRSLDKVAEVAWEMNEGSICGLGQAAALPLTSVLRHFPEVLR